MNEKKITKAAKTFAPFENDTQSTSVGPAGGLTFENSTEDIVVYGDFVITKTVQDAARLQEMIDLLEVIKRSINSNPKNTPAAR